MRIGGLIKFSLIDYPGLVSAVVFTQGCSLRCHYCHNPELVHPKHFQEPLSLESVFSFLETRRGKLDGVVISGGEPTLHRELIPTIKKIKEMGFQVKLDTSGIKPEVLSTLIDKELLDYIAMDIKAPLEKYQQVSPTTIPIAKIKESIEIILNSQVEHEFRTTLLKSWHSLSDILAMSQSICGAQKYILQQYRPNDEECPILGKEEVYEKEELLPIVNDIEDYVMTCTLR